MEDYSSDSPYPSDSKGNEYLLEENDNNALSRDIERISKKLNTLNDLIVINLFLLVFTLATILIQVWIIR